MQFAAESRICRNGGKQKRPAYHVLCDMYPLIEKIHPHMFRHTFVSILLSNPNIGVATVAAEAGHAQLSTTLAICTQVYDTRRKEIRKQMSKELYK